MTNKELVERVRGGDVESIEKLLQNNQEYLYKLARRLSNNPDVIEDLVQEGSIAILDAAGSYNSAQGGMLLTYATPFIRKAMHSFMAKMALPTAIPTARYSQLRRVSFLVAKFRMEKENTSPLDLLLTICREMNVSEKVACGLLRDFRTIFQEIALGEQWELDVSCLEADPAKVYEQELLAKCIQIALAELAPRERMLIQQHLGLDGSRREGMTFRELAVMLNYNGHSAAEKAYKRSVDSLKNALYESKYGNYLRAKHALKWLLSN
ncbi:sigma-70 family RNA polymerase sigma factor [Oscillospiraceae bacterium 42-9]